MLVVRSTYIGCMKRQTLAQLIQRTREQKGLTQEGLAELTGISRSTIANIEAGNTKLPKPPQLAALERHLGVTREEILRAAGQLDEPEEDVLAAMYQIDRLSTEAERLDAFRSLPDPIRRAIRKLASDFLSAATQELLESDGPRADHI